jgi:hypothetical protein
MTTLVKIFIFAVFVTVFTALSFSFGWAAPLPLEGSLSTSGQLDFVPLYNLQTPEFSVSGGGTSQDVGLLIFTPPGGADVLSGHSIGSLIDLDTSWLLQTRGPNIFPPTFHGTLHFDTPEFPVPNCGQCAVSNIPFTATGTLLGQEVTGSGLAFAGFLPLEFVQSFRYTFTPTTAGAGVVPEPATWLLLSSGLCALALRWYVLSRLSRHASRGSARIAIMMSNAHPNEPSRRAVTGGNHGRLAENQSAG